MIEKTEDFLEGMEVHCAVEHQPRPEGVAYAHRFCVTAGVTAFARRPRELHGFRSDFGTGIPFFLTWEWIGGESMCAEEC
jgi:hypothetical protein